MSLFYDEDDRHYMYVITRRDMPENIASVQGAHAIMEHYLSGRGGDKHPAVCYLTVDDQEALLTLRVSCEWRDMNITGFVENFGELDGQLTGLCCGPLAKHNKLRRLFSQCKLLGDNDESI